ncbi:MAG: hypothetical protein HUJ96_00115 [Marinilabiliaceae bacterium]|nr:hypothetical protein [Marinilabiliaceae bacterium]
MCKETEPRADFIGYDLFGYEYNCKFPPNVERYGNEYRGYATENQMALFYDFCILQYGIAFYYENVAYEAEFSDNGPILKNLDTGIVQGPFDDAIKLIEESNVGDCKLINVLDSLENIILH